MNLSNSPAPANLVRHSFRMSSLTPHQEALLGQLVDDKLTIGNRTFSRSDLMAIFSGHQLPRDPEVCKALGLPSMGFADLKTPSTSARFLKA